MAAIIGLAFLIASWVRAAQAEAMPGTTDLTLWGIACFLILQSFL